LGLPVRDRPDGGARRLPLLPLPESQVALGFGDRFLEWVGSQDRGLVSAESAAPNPEYHE
jgi:hypothetical protein